MQSLTKHTAGNFGDTSLATTTKLTMFRRKYAKIILSQQNDNDKEKSCKSCKNTHTNTT